MIVTRSIFDLASYQYLPRPIKRCLATSLPRYLARLITLQGEGNRTVAGAALELLCGQVLAGQLPAGRLWNLPGNVPIMVSQRIGIKTHKLWNESAVNAELNLLAVTSQNPRHLSALCLNQTRLSGYEAIGIRAAQNRHTFWPDALAALVRLGPQSAYLVERVLTAHSADRAAIEAGIRRENPKLWSALQLHRKETK